MAEVSYLIPEPTESIKNHIGSLLFTNSNKKYYALKLNPDNHTEKWWAIGMIAKMGGWYKPIVVSTVQDYASTMSDDENKPYKVSISFEYNGIQYYVSSYTSALQSFSGSQNIPTCETTYSVADTDSSMTEAGKKLIDLYVADGGKLPTEGEEEYPTSWIRKLVNNNWENSFTYAHAKTVYVDYVNKITLDQELKDIKQLLNTNISEVNALIGEVN